MIQANSKIDSGITNEPVKIGESSWSCTLEQDPETGDLIMPLPTELMDSQGWAIGDTLEWTENKNGSWTLQKN